MNKKVKTACEKYDSDHQIFVNQLDRGEDKIIKRHDALAGKKSAIAEAHGNPNALGMT